MDKVITLSQFSTGLTQMKEDYENKIGESSSVVIKEVSNPLTIEPLEYGIARISSSRININHPAETNVILEETDGNLNLVNGSVMLKAGRTYNLKTIFSVDSESSEGFYVRIVNADTGAHIKSASCCPATLNTHNRVSANYCETIYTATEDIAVTVFFTQKMTNIYNLLLSVQEIRNNPVNQYGGFEKEVLFEGNINTAGDYTLSDSVDNYNVLIFESKKPMDKELCIPLLQSNGDGGYNVTCSNEYSEDYSGWKAFNGTVTNSTDSWVSNGTGENWLCIQLPKPQVINAYTIATRVGDTGDSTPRIFEIQGSNNGTTWDVLDRQDISEVTIASNKSITLDFEYENEVPYLYYRLYSYKSNKTYTGLGELSLYFMSTDPIKKNDVCDISKEDNSFISVKAIDDKEFLLRAKGNTLSVVNIKNMTQKSYISRVIGVYGCLPSLLMGGEF